MHVTQSKVPGWLLTPENMLADASSLKEHNLSQTQLWSEQRLLPISSNVHHNRKNVVSAQLIPRDAVLEDWSLADSSYICSSHISHVPEPLKNS